MNCLDTYALVEIKNNSPGYAGIINSEFIIADLTLAEFYWVLLRDENREVAYAWYRKLKPFTVSSSDLFIEAMDFRFKNKGLNMSFFDCVGYLVAMQHHANFVTGDKAFSRMKNVRFIK